MLRRDFLGAGAGLVSLIPSSFVFASLPRATPKSVPVLVGPGQYIEMNVTLKRSDGYPLDPEAMLSLVGKRVSFKVFDYPVCGWLYGGHKIDENSDALISGFSSKRSSDGQLVTKSHVVVFSVDGTIIPYNSFLFDGKYQILPVYEKAEGVFAIPIDRFAAKKSIAKAAFDGV